MTKKPDMHMGIDIAAGEGTPVLAVYGGVVSETGSSALNGRYIRIETDNGYAVVYAHLSKIQAERAQRVERGDVVGLSGNTGQSSGPHLHYGVYNDGVALNPVEFLIIQYSPEIKAYVLAD